jgi:hypothetical protein
VSLIEDEDLVTVTGRSKDSALTQITGVIDTVVAGGVNFDDVERAAAVTREFNTAGALATGSIGGTLSTVEAASQNASRGCLSATTWAAEEISVVNTVGAQRRHQRIGDVGLSNYVSE